MVVLSCIDVRLNPLLPNVFGVSEEDFIWLRNAGNIITSSMSSTLRSLALACVVKGGREIAIIGHTDCKVRQTSVLELTEGFKRLGIERKELPDNLVEYFGLFASERQNVIKAAEMVRNSPLIGAKIPVHGFLLDLGSGKLEWLVNGYNTLAQNTSVPGSGQLSGQMSESLGSFATSHDPTPSLPKQQSDIPLQTPVDDDPSRRRHPLEAKPAASRQGPPIIHDWKVDGGRYTAERKAPPQAPPVIHAPPAIKGIQTKRTPL